MSLIWSYLQENNKRFAIFHFILISILMTFSMVGFLIAGFTYLSYGGRIVLSLSMLFLFSFATMIALDNKANSNPFVFDFWLIMLPLVFGVWVISTITMINSNETKSVFITTFGILYVYSFKISIIFTIGIFYLLTKNQNKKK